MAAVRDPGPDRPESFGQEVTLVLREVAAVQQILGLRRGCVLLSVGLRVEELELAQVDQLEEHLGALDSQSDHRGHFDVEKHVCQQGGAAHHLVAADGKEVGGLQRRALRNQPQLVGRILLSLYLLGLFALLQLRVVRDSDDLRQHLEQLDLLVLVALALALRDDLPVVRLRVALVLELFHDNVKKHLLQNPLRLGLPDEDFVLCNELIEHQLRQVSDLLLELEPSRGRRGTRVGERRVALDEHLDDCLQEGLDLVGAQGVLGRYLLVLA